MFKNSLMIVGVSLLLAACNQPDNARSSSTKAQDNDGRIERGNLVMENIPDIPSSVTDRLLQYQNTRSASFVDWVPGGGMMISTRFGQMSQFHTVEEPGAARQQVTFYNEPVSSGKFAPSGSALHGFVYKRDVGGSEDYQLFFQDSDTGKTRMLTDGQFRNESPVWSHSGDKIAFRSNRRDGKTWDIYFANPSKEGAISLAYQTQTGGYMSPVAFSKDDSKLLISNRVSSIDAHLKVLDLTTGQATTVSIGKGAGATSGTFGADGDSLYLISNRLTDKRILYKYTISTGLSENLSGDIRWEVSSVEVSKNGKHYAFTVNEDGFSKLHIRKTADNAMVKGPKLPAGTIGAMSFNEAGNVLAFSLDRATSPRDVYAYNLTSGKLVRWTSSEVGGLNTANFPEPELVRFPSFDGLEIPALVMKPKGEGPHPVIIRIHGGPASQARPGWSSTYQYWVNELGVTVIQPNVRGSSGYGKAYLSMDDTYKREDSVKDISALLDWIATQPDLDENRIIVYGKSYGGYMVLASMVHYSDRLLGCIDVVGMSNLVTFLEKTRAYRRHHRRFEYGNETDPEMRAHLEAISPNNHVDKITKPMFIIHGYNDPRNHYSDAEQMFASLKANGVPAWFLMAMDEGHGFRKKSNIDFQAAAMSMFITYLLSN